MKHIVPGLACLLILIFSACENRGPEEIAANVIACPISTNSSSTAIINLPAKDTSVVILGKTYTIKVSAWLDSSDTMPYYNVFYTKNNKLDSTLKQGYNGHYHISLVSAEGDTLFSTSFDKHLFEKEIYGEILARADAIDPHFIAYLPEFRASVFTIEIWVPDSDWGQQALVMLDQKGQIIDASWSNSYGGSGCGGDVMISKNGKLISTCGSIYNASGTTAHLDSGKFARVLTEILSDTTVLVIYERNDSTNVNNSWILNDQFKTVARFPYSGYYNILGYVVPRHQESSNHTLYLLDVDQLVLEAVHTSGRHRGIELSKCEKFNTALRKTEKEFVIDTEFGKYTFALDTVKQTVRWKTDKTGY